MIYLASPYSANPEKLHDQALLATSALVSAGYVIFSPIVHCHPLHKIAKLPHDFAFWRNYNFGMIAAAKELWVLALEGWEESVGVRGEIEYARSIRLPVFKVNPVGLKRTEIYCEKNKMENQR